MTGFIKWVGAGCLGGFLGAAVWAAISYGINYEVGYIAWGIGFVVGVCVRFAAGENEEGMAPGITAAAIAILAVVAGKYAMVHLHASKISASEITITANDFVTSYAIAMVEEREAAGKPVTLPSGKSLDSVDGKDDFPPAIWKAAETKWNKLTPEEQQQQIDERKAFTEELVNSMRGEFRQQAFLGSFGLLDALWFFLAAGTAYRLGHGNTSSDD